ncbi:alpha/beta fold hydrolase [Haloarchaeobius iranensis]|uniref:Pimeloyl-ACP methyl ester carboxylesterase n=1 Tax=Haloarchaeobius iranensis TaxID=996166 RepID=A0A1G9SK60_9EURY|nr:alpha/beta hydrolase [Haloarchaeobius iranensis]SDM35792.1 Pimeloyl-ACP methyl ester carboxylesterase [Haloarchaeobius iranensis]
MPTTTRDGTTLQYRTDGDGATVAFVPDIGVGPWFWGWQHAGLAGPFETLTWAMRGTDGSDPPAGPCSVATLANDLDVVLRDHGTDSVHLVGSGLGAMVALHYARNSGRVRKLALLAGAATGDAYDPEPLFADPADAGACRETLSPALSADFRAEQPDVLDGIADWRGDEDADRESWENQRAALDGFDAEPLYEVDHPTLVVVPGADELLDPEAGRRLADELPRGEVVTYPDASHFVGIERSRPVNDALLGFFESED